MYVSEFKKTIDWMADDIQCDGNGSIGSHRVPSSVDFYVEDDDSEYELVDIDIQRLGGCGCASGITIRLKRL